MYRNRPYETNDVIMTCLPFAQSVHSNAKGFYCDSCFCVLNKPQKCLKCRKMFYCSPDCKRRDWEVGRHRHECSLYERDSANRFKCSSIRLMIRIWFLLWEDPSCEANGGVVRLPGGFLTSPNEDEQEEEEEAEEEEVTAAGAPPEGPLRKFADLMSHTANIRRSPEDFGLFQEFWSAIRDVNESPPLLPCLPNQNNNTNNNAAKNGHMKNGIRPPARATNGPNESLCSQDSSESKGINGVHGNPQAKSPHRYPIKESEMLSIYGKVRTNAFVVRDEELRSLGEALYIGASVFDHSCDPNAVTEFSGLELIVRALRPISRREEIFIAYLEADLFTLAGRREKLQRDFYFLCQCPRCDAEEMEERLDGLRL